MLSCVTHSAGHVHVLCPACHVSQATQQLACFSFPAHCKRMYTHTHTHTHTHTCYLRWPGKECVQAFSGTEYMHTCTHSTWSHSIPFLHVSFLSLFSFPLHVPFLLQLLAVTAMLGGTCTLIGTSTNLVVAGFQQNRYPDDPKLSNMGIFDIAPYGLIYASW
jgi:hypothetical protein